MITIFTPTYNRAYTLERLFESLQGQTDRDFEWLVVDDGSTDGTEDLCKDFKGRAIFPMRYFKQENAGKHVAINRGAKEASGEWFFIVDSDDWLPEDSVEFNNEYLGQIANDTTFAGVSGMCACEDGSPLFGLRQNFDDVNARTRELFALDHIDATSQDYRERYKMLGDRAEVIRTSLVRETPFPSFEGERFVSEYYLWQSLSERGLKLRWFNRFTYCGEYLKDGLTTNMREIMRKSPLGRSFVDNFIIGSHAPMQMKLRSAINYIRYGRLGGLLLGSLLSEAKSKLLFLLGLPVALATPLRDDDDGR